MSSHTESSERSASIHLQMLQFLGAQLSEMLTQFNELSAEMAVQRRMIDKLVSNNTSGVQNEHTPIDDSQQDLENPPPHMSHNQTTFVPPFTSPPGGTFTYPIPSLPHTYLNNIFVNPISHQIPQSYPQINVNIPSEPQGPHVIAPPHPKANQRVRRIACPALAGTQSYLHQNRNRIRSPGTDEDPTKCSKELRDINI